MNKENLNNLFNETRHDLQMLNIPVGSISEFSTCKRTAAWGDCTQLKDGSFRIRVSEILLSAKKERIKDTICHELLHTIPGCMNHGKLWKSYANIVNNEYPGKYHIKRTTTAYEKGIDSSQIPSAEIKYKYEVSCNNCGAKFYYKKECKVINYVRKGYECIRCPKCKSSSQFSLNKI